MMATKILITKQGSRPIECANLANVEHRAAIGAAEDAMSHAIRAGELLIEAKAGVPHGDWAGWLEEHFEATDRSARGYMRLARLAGQNGSALPFSSIRGALDSTRKPRESPGPAPIPEPDPVDNEPAAGPVETEEAEDEPAQAPPPRPPTPTRTKPGPDGTYGVDLHGVAIRTREAADQLAAQVEFLEFYQRLEGIQRQVNALVKAGSPRWARFTISTFEESMRNAKKTLDMEQPFGACPFWPNCEHNNCKACKGSGWVTKRAHKTAKKKGNAA
jgi:hypothetical protein